TQLRIVSGTVIAGVFDDSLTHLEGQIQSPKSRVAKLEILHDPQGLQVVVERFTMSAHRRIQRLLACMSKGGMDDIVHQGKRLHQINIQAQLFGNRAGNLRNLDRVGQTIAEMVRVTAGEDLRLVFQPAESTGMNDAVTVSLKIVAIGMSGLGVAPPARI